jgi:hypothetical protein
VSKAVHNRILRCPDCRDFTYKNSIFCGGYSNEFDVFKYSPSSFESFAIAWGA